MRLDPCRYFFAHPDAIGNADAVISIAYKVQARNAPGGFLNFR